jgi:hypothetical protein
MKDCSQYVFVISLLSTQHYGGRAKAITLNKMVLNVSLLVFFDEKFCQANKLPIQISV